MNQTSEKLTTWLFQTKAVRVCPQDKPFWYTSGTIGPYFINTHFLYGSEEKANDLLKVIDREKGNILECSDVVLKMTLENYAQDSIYKGLIDAMIEYIKANIDINAVDYISGGERRDWFFSLIIAHILEKPHITLYKNLKSVVYCKGISNEIQNIQEKKVLHIADLITEASSYERAWIPAIEALGGKLIWSVVVVDRMQGGSDLLKNHGIESFAMVNIDPGMFEKALSQGHINEEQYHMVLDFIKQPKESMKNFLVSHPEFLKDALHGDEKTKERAKLCIEKNIYSL